MPEFWCCRRKISRTAKNTIIKNWGLLKGEKEQAQGPLNAHLYTTLYSLMSYICVRHTMTRVQYSLTTCPSLTVVPFSSMIQCSRTTWGLAFTSHRTNTLRSPRAAQLSAHVITAESVGIQQKSKCVNKVILRKQESKDDYLTCLRS